MFVIHVTCEIMFSISKFEIMEYMFCELKYDILHKKNSDCHLNYYYALCSTTDGLSELLGNSGMRESREREGGREKYGHGVYTFLLFSPSKIKCPIIRLSAHIAFRWTRFNNKKRVKSELFAGWLMS